MEGCIKHTFGPFLEDHVCEEAVLLCGELHYIHWQIIPITPQDALSCLFVFSPLDVLVHICMSVAVWHHNSSHLWCLCSFIRSLPLCSSAALCKLWWFITFFFAHQWSEHTGKATVCRGVWDIICHNHFTDEGTITTSAESSRHTLTSSGLWRENYTASVLCYLWSTWMTFCFVFF